MTDMSMLSAQCDELRAMAESVGLAVPQAATLMMGAADTILELRDDLQRANAENARLRSELESVGTAAYLYGRGDLKVEDAKLKEQVERLQPKDCEGNVLDIADTVHMLRSEYDGDHEWEDVVVELALTKWGGDRWIVRGSKGEAWACECTKTGYDEDAFEDSDDVEPFDDATLAETENAKLRKLVSDFDKCLTEAARMAYIQGHMTIYDGTLLDSLHPRMRELGIEVDG